MPQPWERQPGETDASYRAFCTYRNMGPKRTLEAVARKDDKGIKKGYVPGCYCEWSSQFRWVERAAAYDDYLDELRRKADEEAIIKMSQVHAKGMRQIFKKGLDRIKALDDEKITGSLALELTMNGMKGERLARGLTTDSIAQTVNGGGPQLHLLGDAIQRDPAVREKAYELLNAASRRRAEGGQG